MRNKCPGFHILTVIKIKTFENFERTSAYVDLKFCMKKKDFKQGKRRSDR